MENNCNLSIWEAEVGISGCQGPPPTHSAFKDSRCLLQKQNKTKKPENKQKASKPKKNN